MMFTRVIRPASTGMRSHPSLTDRPNPLLVEPKLMFLRVERRMLRRERLPWFPDQVQLPAIEATVEHDLTVARANGAPRHLVERSSPAALPCCAASQPVSPDREIGAKLYISLNTVKTHTHEPYRKLGPTSRTASSAQVRGRTRTRTRAQARSGCSILNESPG
jgi:hypothetical protein